MVVRREVVNHFHERTDQILQRFLVQGIEEHHVGAVVSVSEVVDGPCARPTERRAEKGCQVGFILVCGLLGEQFDSSFEIDLLESADSEEPVEGIVL